MQSDGHLLHMFTSGHHWVMYTQVCARQLTWQVGLKLGAWSTSLARQPFRLLAAGGQWVSTDRRGSTFSACLASSGFCSVSSTSSSYCPLFRTQAAVLSTGDIVAESTGDWTWTRNTHEYHPKQLIHWLCFRESYSRKTAWWPPRSNKHSQF